MGNRSSGGDRRTETVAAVGELLESVRRDANAARTGIAIRSARRGLALLRAYPDERVLRATLLTNLASCLAQRGRAHNALELLDEAVAIDPGQTPVVESKRGMILERARSYREALAALTVAVEFRPVPDDRTLATALIRRGIVNIFLGRLDHAITDFSRAGSMADAAGLPILSWFALHNLGYARGTAGDLPGALAAMAAADGIEVDKPSGEPELDRARVLLTAGLLHEARQFATRALERFDADRTPTEQVEALLALTDICVAEGDFDAAAHFARRAVAVTGRHRMDRWALVARLAQLRAVRQPPPRRALAAIRTRSHTLAESLRADGFADEAATAYLIGAEAELAAGALESARNTIEKVTRLNRTPSLPVRLHRHLVAGRVGLAVGERTVALGELRRGLDDLTEFQAHFGSQDLQSAASVHGRQLGWLGLGVAMDSGSPAAVLTWLERSRAVTTRLPVVAPPGDPELAGLLAALRVASGQVRAALLAGRPDPARRRTVAALQQQVRARSWTAVGTGMARRPLTLRAVQQQLAAHPAGPTVVAYFAARGRLHALVITAGRAKYRQLGPWLPADPRHRRRQADLDLLATARVPPAIRSVAARSLHAELARLSAETLDPIAGRLDPGPLLLAVTGDLALLPWGLLPGLAGRAVSVNSSVGAALTGPAASAAHRHAAPRHGAHRHGVLAVAGPGLAHSAAEVREVAALHPGAEILQDGGATGAAVLAAMPAGGLLHVAAHGQHEPESPLFSSVLLADGPLFAYDLAPNPARPAQVVLSSCEVGRTDDRPGGEPLGLAAALLRSGVDTVIAAVGRVNDQVAAEVMIAYHRRLIAGDGPATALARAVADTDPAEPAAFSCFGAG